MTSKVEHYFERNIVEIKKDYTDYLISIISPFLYEGFQSLYRSAISTEKQLIEMAKNQPQITNPGTLILFQNFIKKIPDLNDDKISKEAARIRDLSGCADFFDNLVKAVIKSNIILLTYSASGKQCKLINEKFHQNVDVKTFIHKCYVECARIFYSHVELFWHEFKSNDLAYNQKSILQLIRVGIIRAIRHMLPMKAILEEYLQKDYIEIEDDKAKYKSIREIIKRDLGEDFGGTGKIFMSSDENKYDDIGKDDDALILGDDTLEMENPEKMKEFMEVVEQYNIVPEQKQDENHDNINQENVHEDEYEKEKISPSIPVVEKQQSEKETKLPNSFEMNHELSNDNKLLDAIKEAGDLSTRETIIDKLMAGNKGKRSKKVPTNDILMDVIEQAQKANNRSELKLKKVSVDKPRASEIQPDNYYFDGLLK